MNSKLKRFVLAWALFPLLAFAPTVDAQAPAAGSVAPPAAVATAPPATSALTLSQDELALLGDSIEQLKKADQDLQTARLFGEAAQAKAERASLLIEGRKLRMLAMRGLSPDTHEVTYLTDEKGQNGRWVVRLKLKDEKKP